jgi:polyisoprenoid-binding protein YceI
MHILTATEVRERLATATPPLLVHVLPPEHFAARRIPAAVNVCTYETAFIDKMRSLAPDTRLPIIVYGEGAPSLDSADAAERLVSAGYADVSDFRGGLREWEAARLPVDGGAPLPATPALDGIFEVDCKTSVIRWTGRNLFNHHEGTLKFASGSLDLRQGALDHGTLVIDMNSIACADLEDRSLNVMLIQHLRTTDFFDIENHPTATVAIKRAAAIPDAAAGLPNHEFAVSLTLRGVERKLSFPAVVAAADAQHVTAQAQMEFDRTQFGSHYGSGRFFAYLGQHVVNDHIQLHLKIHAARE